MTYPTARLTLLGSVLLMMSTFAWSQPAPILPSVDTFRGGPQLNAYDYNSVLEHLDVFIDSTGEISIQSIPKAWEQQGSPLREVSYSRDYTYWLRIRVAGRNQQDTERWFWQTMLGWERAEIYTPYSREPQILDRSRDPAMKELPFWLPFFSVRVPPEDTATVWVHLTPYPPDWLSTDLRRPYLYEVDPHSFQSTLPRRSYLTGMYQGVFLIQVLFFLMVFLLYRDRSLWYLALMLGGFLILDLHESLLKEEYSPFPWLYDTHWMFFIRYPGNVLFFYGLMMFPAAFLHLGERRQQVRRFIHIFTLVFSLVCACAFLDEQTQYYVPGYSVMQLYRIVALCGFLLVSGYAVVAKVRRVPYSGWFLLGMVPILLAGLIGVMATVFGFVRSLPIPYRDLHRLGTMGAMITFGIAAGYRLKQMRTQQEEATRLQALDEAKSRFFTHITHEFRTPLTVIMGLTGELQKQLGSELKTQAGMVRHNGAQLLKLINQMLDLARIDAGQLKLQWRQSDIVRYTHYLTESFHSWAGQKNIDLTFRSDPDQLIMDFPPQQLQQILTNLLANALKYTPEGGTVRVTVRQPDLYHLEIAVSDSGPGIPSELIPRIFDPFYQVNQISGQQLGSGIGLAVVDQLIQLMRGRIDVDSTVGQGSTFRLLLPVRREAELRPDVLADLGPIQQVDDQLILQPVKTISAFAKNNLVGEQDRLSVLIVEDHPDVTYFLRLCLSEEYDILEAPDGLIGLEKALAWLPDLIISDVMMPGMDGFDLCQKIKQDWRTAHIPVILLTAKADREARLEGLEYGADAYLVKPFDREELELRIRKLIEARRKLQQVFQQARDAYSNDHSGPDLGLPDQEVQFLRKLHQTIVDNLGEEGFSVQRLADAMEMSRMQLHRKIKALTGRNSSGYLRWVRLQHANRMLRQTDRTIGEIAFAVGFKSLSHFSQVYQEEFGQVPSESRK